MIEATIPATAKRPIKKDPAEDEVTAGLAWTGLLMFLCISLILLLPPVKRSLNSIATLVYRIKRNTTGFPVV
jgi:hypothetical protein